MESEFKNKKIDHWVDGLVKRAMPKGIDKDSSNYGNHYMLALTFLVAVCLELLMAIASVSIGFYEGAVVRAIAILLLLVGLFNFKRGQNMTHLSYVTMLMLGMVTTASILLTGGFYHSIFSCWLFFTVIFGFMVIGRQGGLIAGGYVLLLCIALESLHRQDIGNLSYIPEQHSNLFTLISLMVFISTNFLVGFFFNQQHVTKNKLAETLEELKITQQSLVQQEKLAGLSEMAAGIAHELKNPLNFVNNFAKLSQEVLLEFEKANAEERKEIVENIRANLDKVIGHGQRADKILQSMLSHSRRPETKQAATISLIIEKAAGQAQKAANTNLPMLRIDVQTHTEPNLPDIHVVEEDIRRVLVNVVDNALYAVNERNEKEQNYTPMVSVAASLIKEEKWLHISVTDNGHGMSEDVKKRIFDPFYTTKPPGQGTGLGLSLSYEIVTKTHAGKFECHSEPGFGARFDIYLPTE